MLQSPFAPKCKYSNHRRLQANTLLQSLIPPILVTLAKRAVRHARLATSFEHDKETHTTTQLSFQRTLQMLRREVIRAIRHEQLEFRYPKGSTFRPTAKSLKGKEWELASFINAACFAVTRALGCFDAPLLKPNAKARASDEMVLDFWDCDGLGIWWDAGVGWRVEGMGEGVLGDLSIEGSVEGGSNTEERGWEDVSGEEGWANDVSESEDEIDQASLYETRLKSEEGSLQEKEHKERIGRDTQTVLFADEEKALEGWKEGHRAVGNQEPVVSQWYVRGSREMMGDEMMGDEMVDGDAWCEILDHFLLGS